MALSTNPFEVLEKELAEIKKILNELPGNIAPPPATPDQFKFVPIKEIFKNFCSKPTFYEHVRAGRITLYKFGGKSFVDKEEFEKAFIKINIKNL